MKVSEARAAATDWVTRIGCQQPGFRGAYLSGSTVGLAAGAELPTGSDVDIMLVTADPGKTIKLGKFLHEGALLEVSYLPWEAFSSAEGVLASYHLAGGLRTDTIIADPTGRLRGIQSEVAAGFPDPTWVRRRCRNARERIAAGLRGIDTTAPWHDQVTSWLFPGGVTTHVVLVAALRNPTIRLRYLAAREVLLQYHHSETYEQLLGFLGCADLTAEAVGRQLAGLERTFDAAAAVSRTPFFFSTDITRTARPIAIDASWNLIRSGRHREAVFWIVATYARCHKILAADDPATERSLRPAFDDALADLGIASSADLLDRAERVIDFLPRLDEVTEEIIQANPEVHAAEPLRAERLSR